MSRDLRKYARQTNILLLVGFILLLLMVGDGLIYLIYGPGAAVSGLLCILAGLSPLLLIYLVLVIIDRIVNILNQ
jgi:hypothetical protein